MLLRRTETVPIRAEVDIVVVRQAVRRAATESGFSVVEQTKLVTAASELARNAWTYAGGGDVTLEVLADGRRHGVRVIVEDKGPGIADVEQAMTDGFTTGVGMGLGLGGARRLSNEFEIASAVGKGTRVMIARWKE